MPDVRYHTCGGKISITWQWNGLVEYPVCLDENGEETDDWICPHCGEYIYRYELLTTVSTTDA